MKTCTNNDIIRLLIESDAMAETDEFLPDVPLKQMGIQSLDKFNLFLLIEESFDLEIPDDQLERLDSISSIAEYVTANLPTEVCQCTLFSPKFTHYILNMESIYVWKCCSCIFQKSGNPRLLPNELHLSKKPLTQSEPV